MIGQVWVSLCTSIYYKISLYFGQFVCWRWKVNRMENSHQTLYPILPLRDVVMFPYMIVPLFGRVKNLFGHSKMWWKRISRSHYWLNLTPASDVPSNKDLYTVGTVSSVLQMLKLPDDIVKVLVEGVGIRPRWPLCWEWALPASTCQHFGRENRNDRWK